MASSVKRSALMGSVAVAALVAGAASAMAGGFAIREQSAESQGASFAGSAAGTGLGAMFWNPAAAANKSGFNTESSYSILTPRAEVTVEGKTGLLAGATTGPASTEIGHNAFVGGSYANYQISKDMFLGLSINSPFGLATEPEVGNYQGAALGRRTQLLTFNAAPTLAYNVMPGVTVGVGAQIEYGKGTFKFATGVPNAPSSSFIGDDFAFGATAGIMLAPAAGTRVGLGWRSAMTHTLDGTFNGPAVPKIAPAANYNGTADVKLPDIVTLSINQAIAPNMRLLGTVEWTNWSRFNELRVKDSTGAHKDLVIDANWSDSWFTSIGAEYDYSSRMTLRSGVAYEWSPIDDPKKRLLGIPDSNRVWLSAGGSYKVTEATTVDLSFTHIFLQDARFDRHVTAGAAALNETGTVEASTNIFSFGLKTKW